MNLLILILFLIILGIICLIFTIFLFPFFTGAPYVPCPREKIKKMIEMTSADSGQTLYDLGSGDGRIVIEAVKNYDLKAVGIEINPILVFLSNRKIKKMGLQKKARVYWKNIFKVDLSKADIIISYLLQPTNNLLEKKLLKECKKETKVLTLAFSFKNIPQKGKDSGITLYEIE